jgi:hypothetical protein
MTPNRLRQIADRMERVCSNYQEKIGSGYIACKSCKEAANELRFLAAQAQDLEEQRLVKAGKGALASVSPDGPVLVEAIDHQPAGRKDAR